MPPLMQVCRAGLPVGISCVVFKHIFW